MKDSQRFDDDAERLAIDYVLGQVDADVHDAVHARVEQDIDVALEVAEMRALLESAREVTVEPTGHVGLAVRHAVRQRVRREESGSPIHVRVRRVAEVAFVAAAALLVFVLVDRVARRTSAKVGVTRSAWDELFALPRVVERGAGPGERDRTVDRDVARLLSEDAVPVDDALFRAALDRLSSRPLAASFHDGTDAALELGALRDRFRLRFSRLERRSALRAAGAPDLQDRLDVLADTVAIRLTGILGRAAARSTGDSASIGQQQGRLDRDHESCDLAIGLRALLAAGSSRTYGPHREIVESVAVELVEHRLGELQDDGPRASVLAALSELAVSEGGPLVDLVGLHAAQLVRHTLERPPEGGRPDLLHWRSSIAQLADAGRLLRRAPAFGVHPGLAFRARMLVAAHLEERLEGLPHREAPSLVAAQLYGFDDIVDRNVAERALRLWRPELLVPRFETLHHIAWSKSPSRSGWADFQQDLRGLASVETPESVREAAALYLCLAVNFASPSTAIAILG